MKIFEPVIKWTGSKRSQSSYIVERFPDVIDTYYEPCVGGGSVMISLMTNPSKKVNRYVISDINPHLMNLWETIRAYPSYLSENYRIIWSCLKEKKSISDKTEYYNFVRDSVNECDLSMSEYPNMFVASQFMFLMRTCFNGMPRYNKKGEFNTSFHMNRDGIRPERLAKIIREWSDILNRNNVEFRTCSYTDIHPESARDFVYLDPPYKNTKGIYFGDLGRTELINWFRTLKCSYAMSYNGIAVSNDTDVFPEDIFDEHVYVTSGNSSFRRIKGISSDTVVKESLYIKN